MWADPYPIQKIDSLVEAEKNGTFNENVDNPVSRDLGRGLNRRRQVLNQIEELGL